MSLADARIEQTGNNQFNVSYGDDSKCYVEFEKKPVEQTYESERAGRPIWKDMDFITIMFPGNSTTRIVRVADKHRWPQQWAQYQRQEEQTLTGTPLEQWAPLTKSDVLMLKGSGVHTVEGLAGVSDANIDNIGLGMRSYRERAILFLDAAKGDEAINQLYSDNKDLKSEIQALKTQIAEIGKAKAKGN
jgi:hypothetical protein